MHVGILCRPLCPNAIRSLRLFADNDLPIRLVVIEHANRRKYLPTELAFRRAEAEFSRRVGRGAYRPRPMDRLYLWLPEWMKRPVRRAIQTLPVLRRRTVAAVAQRLGAAVVHVDRLSCERTVQALEEHQIDYALLCSTSWLIKEPLLSGRAKIINGHCGRLPRHRSLHSLPWSVAEGDQVGLTTHFVDAGVDTGPILRFREVSPQPGDTLRSLQLRVDAARPSLFLETLRGLDAGTVRPTPQDPAAGIHHRPMTVEELLQAEAALQQMLVSACPPV